MQDVEDKITKTFAYWRLGDLSDNMNLLEEFYTSSKLEYINLTPR